MKTIPSTINRTTPYSPTCMKIMDFFIQNPTLYFTPITVFKSSDFDVSTFTVKHCMSLLHKNSYLTKDSLQGTAYHITKENMEFWVTDFRNYILAKEELMNTENIQSEQIEKNNKEVFFWD